ncbi:MAG: aspartate aminotransferase family protein [Anaerolineae bacterium]|nr:aspartate aminotransferase family protein [Anaerolineae bacterium]
MNLMDIEKQYTSGFYGKRDVVLVKGQNAHVWDVDGREYIDCVAGIGVANAGHSHPAIAAAIAEQAQTLMTCPELFYNNRRAELYQKLAEMTPEGIDRFFLCNSGTEAVEGAIKMARLSTGRQGIVAASNAFHGRTLGALTATYKKDYREPFGPLVPGFDRVPYNDVEALEAAVTGETAAVILEVVQGEGGIHPGDGDYIRAAREICNTQDALLILDEVQTGFGRTGRWFACQHHGVVPDLLTMGKAIAGGMPMGAVGIGSGVDGMKPGLHGSTFGGNPLACATSLAALEVYQSEQLQARATEMGEYFRERLEEINSPLIREVRGMGLMIGVEFKVRASKVVEGLIEHGVLTLTSGTTVMRLLPPLTIPREDIDTVIEALCDVLVQMENGSK